MRISDWTQSRRLINRIAGSCVGSQSVIILISGESRWKNRGFVPENGRPKVTSQDQSLALGVRVIDKSGIPAAGFYVAGSWAGKRFEEFH